MTREEAIKQATVRLSKSNTARLDAEVLLAHVLDCDRSELISKGEDVLSPKVQDDYQKMIGQRQAGKPVAYLTHKKAFFGRDFFVDHRALIPRPETEEMVEDAIGIITEDRRHKTIVDLGSGCGAIAITMALEFPKLHVYGLEVSEKALEVSAENHQRFPCKNLSFIQSDLLDKLPESNKPLVILANLPYIGREQNTYVAKETLLYEPELALYGGTDGLELYRRTWQQIIDRQLNIEALFMEIGFSQAEMIVKECREAFPKHSVSVMNDLAGLPRTVIVKKT